MLDMDFTQAESVIDGLVEQAQKELDGLTNEQKEMLAGGYDNRGLDCISQRWYGPDEMRKNSALSALGSIINKIEDLMRDFHSSVEFTEE